MELNDISCRCSVLKMFSSSDLISSHSVFDPSTQNLATDGRTPLKRNLKHVNNKSFQDWSHRPLAYKQISKRVCRNLTTVFCSESSDTSNCSEPNLDLWVLRMLGLKDRDTIDTSSDSPSDYNLRDLVYDAASTPFLSPEYTPNSSLDSQLATSTASSAHSYCQRLTHETDDGNTYTGCNNHATSTENCTGTLEDFTAVGLMRSHESHEAVIGSYDTSTAFQSNRPEICSIAASSGVETQQGNYSEQPSYWCPLSDSQTPAEPDFFSPMLSSSPLENQSWMSAGGHSPTTQSASSQLPATPQTPRRQTDLAFSMFLSPSSSVKTHSFPQGQAFIRRDPGGRWNFTWLPTQEP